MNDTPERVHGRRVVHFERTGPDPGALETVFQDDDEGVHVEIHSGEHEHSIEISGSAPAEKRRALITRLDELAAALADPERRATTAVPSDADDLPTYPDAPQSLSRTEAIRLAIEAIDLTTLAGDDTPGRVRALCAQAMQPDPTDSSVPAVAAVCVYPNLVPIAVELLAESPVKVASVAGAFPSGLSSLPVRLLDIDDAVASGADEIDVVVNRSAFLSGDMVTATAELSAMRDRAAGTALKVILETSELASGSLIRAAAELAIRAGADWVKTSTGKSARGATPDGVAAMCRAVAAHGESGGRPVGIKVSGGVRTTSDALAYLALVEAELGSDWLTPERVRFGASGLLASLVADLADG